MSSKKVIKTASLTALTVSVTLLFMGSTHAAPTFEAYGIIDTGLALRNGPDGNGGNETRFTMESGVMMGNRLGIRGRDTISGDLTVSFVLEGGFDTDTGQLYSYSGDRSRIFGRETQVSLETKFGTLTFGRVGNFFSGNGTYGIWAPNASPYSIGYLESGSQYTMFGYTRLDNSVTYKSPTFAGFNFLMQYSLQTNFQENDQESKNNRQLGGALLYQNGKLKTMAIVEWLNRANQDGSEIDDQILAGVNLSYDFTSFKPYIAFQYQRSVQRLFAAVDGTTISSMASNGNEGITGYTFALGTDIALWNGTLKSGIQYYDGKDDADSQSDFRRFILGIGYRYPFSKKVSLYMGVNYVNDDLETSDRKIDDDLVTVFSGLNYRF